MSIKNIKPSVIIYCLACGLLVSSCSKDEEGIPNRLIINETTYSLSKGYIKGYGIYEDDENNLGSVYEVLLTTSGLTLTGDDLTGTGQCYTWHCFHPQRLNWLKEPTRLIPLFWRATCWKEQPLTVTFQPVR